jgi:hypothetical protein
VAHDGTFYATVLYPFTLLRVPPPPAAGKEKRQADSTAGPACHVEEALQKE